MALIDEVCDFLTRLGLTIERGKGGRVTARRRTALMEEHLEYLVAERPPSRVPKKATLILPSGSPPPPDNVKGAWLYFDDFLDQAVQADRIARETAELTFDTEVRDRLSVFVPQHISEAGSRYPKDAVSFFFQDWLPDPNSRLLVVLAPAGYGKTLLTYSLAQRLAQAHLGSQTSPRQPLPFLVPFGRFRRAGEFGAMVVTSLQSQGVMDLTPGSFGYLVGRNRVVLFLDGFDELLEERPAEAQKNLREFIETLRGEGKVLITARSTFFRTSLDVADFLEHYLEPDDVQVMELMAFTADQRRQVIARVSPDQRTINRIESIVESDAIREAMGSPLLLRETVEALVAGDARLPSSPSRAELFDVLEHSVYERERKRHSHLFHDRVQQKMLKVLAGETLKENVRGLEMDLVRVSAVEATADGEISDADLEKLADHHFLTVDAEADEVRFNHQVFREYFQARWMIDTLESGKDEEVAAVLSRRPIPEGVATFFTELASQKTGRALLKCVGDNQWRSERLVNNVASIYATVRNADYFRELLEVADKERPLSFRVQDMRLDDFDFGSRVLGRVDFLDCSMRRANFSGSILQNVSFHNCDVQGTTFEGASAEVLILDYGNRIFGTKAALLALHARGAYCGDEFEERIEELTQDWREQVRDIVKGRFRRFYLPGAGPEASRWDVTIKDRTLLGGLDQAERAFVLGELIPRMVGLNLLRRERAHGETIFHLTDEARDEARALLERDEEIGAVKQLIDRLAA